MNINQVTATDAKAKSMAKHGRHGDTEMAHVTPGEMVLPHSIQTPRVMSVVAQEFQEQGVPADRYVVKSTKNSENPDTGKGEFFLKSIVKAAAPIVGGAIGGPAGAAVGSAIAGGIGGSAAGGATAAAGGGAVAEANPLPQPVKFLAESGGVNPAQIASVAPIMQIAAQGGQQMPQQPAPMQQAPQQIAGAPGPMPAVPPNFNPAQIGGIHSVNSMTGRPEFYDAKQGKEWAGAARPKNPTTRRQEFFDAAAYAAANPDVAAAGVDPLSHYLQYGIAEGRALFPANYQPPAATPNAPAPANASTNNPTWDDAAYLAANPDVLEAIKNGTFLGSGLDHFTNHGKAEGRTLGGNNSLETAPVPIATAAAPAAPAPVQNTITGLYTDQGSFGTMSPMVPGTGLSASTIVQASDGKFYRPFINPQTGAIDKYERVDSLPEWTKPITYKNNLGLEAGPATSHKLSPNATLKLGDSFSWTDPNAPAAPAAASGYKAPAKIETTTTAEPEEPQAPDLGEELYGAEKQNDYPSWYESLKSDISGLKDSLSSSSSDSSTTTTTTPAADPNANLASTSKLSPQRENRFRSRAREGSLARNF